MAAGGIADGYAGFRARLVEELRNRGIQDLSILRAFGQVPRHLFVPPALRHRAYEDTALPVGGGQTISQPSTQARYLEALNLRGTERVLEIGTGTGYQAALLASLAPQVFTVERIPALAEAARAALAAASADSRVTVLLGDGSLGWRPFGPYDAILISAAGPEIPRPLIDQLAKGGRLVGPVQGRAGQTLVRLTRKGGGVTEEVLSEANFVPLIGRHGFAPPKA
jgi:protein-L-isoaspartate(D-aspartate) O-methyltransferase